MRASLAAFLVLVPGTSWAQSVSLTARSVYHAYEIQLTPGAGDRARNLNRFYQSLDAGGWGLIPGEDFSAVLSLRYDTDFGTGFASDTPDAAGIPAVGGRNDLDLLYLYVDWRGLADKLDVRLGRQVLVDDLDWYVFDGLKLTFHALGTGEERLDLSFYAGPPVRYERLFSTESGFIGDGTQIDDGGRIRGLALGGSAAFSMFGLSLSAAFRQELVFRGDPIDTFGPDADAAARSAGTFAMQESLLGGSVSYSLRPAALTVFGHLTWNLLVGKLDNARAGLGWDPWRGFHVGAEYIRSRPRFLGDSIWNYFNIFPYDKGRFEVSYAFLWFTLSASYYIQEFSGGSVGSSDAEFTGSDFNHGPGGGITFAYDGLKAGVYAEGSSNISTDYGYGGNYRYAFAFLDGDLWDGLLGAMARFSLTTVQDDWFEGLDPGGVVADPQTSFALNVGLRSRPVRYVSIRANFIKNFRTELEGSYRIYSELALHY